MGEACPHIDHDVEDLQPLLFLCLGDLTALTLRSLNIHKKRTRVLKRQSEGRTGRDRLAFQIA